MKKKVAKKLSLSRETIHRLAGPALARVGGAFEDDATVIGKDTALSIKACTQVISDCLTCTTPEASCPRTMFSYCTCA